MLTKILFILKRAFWFVIDNWKVVLPVIAVLVVVFFVYRSIGRKGIDIKNIEKINSENRKERLQELQKVVEENQETIKTVDDRDTLANTHVAERNAEIDAKVTQADKAIIEAKRQGRDITSEELECVLLPEKCK